MIAELNLESKVVVASNESTEVRVLGSEPKVEHNELKGVEYFSKYNDPAEQDAEPVNQLMKWILGDSHNGWEI